MRLYTILLLLILCSPTSYALGLKQVEQIALDRANETKEFRDKSSALSSQAIADNQLPDPTLQVGALNLPTNSFSLSQEMMSQIQVGISQVFPKGKTLKYRYLKTRHLAGAAKEQEELQRILILKKVRELWDLVYLWKKSEQILLSQRDTFKQLKKVAGSLFANNKVPQKDVLNAQLELSQIDEQLVQVRQAQENTRVELARWVGDSVSRQISVNKLPMWVSRAKLRHLSKYISAHPILKVDRENIRANESQVQITKQDYLPGFSVGVSYGYRQGTGILGMKKPDFLSSAVQVSLPLFPKNRQDKKLLSSQKNLSSAKEKLHANYKELKKLLSTSVVDFNKTQEKIALYKKSLLPEAKQYANSTLIAYQNARSDFINVAQSHVRWLNIELGLVREQIKNRQAQINILYVQGK